MGVQREIIQVNPHDIPEKQRGPEQDHKKTGGIAQHQQQNPQPSLIHGFIPSRNASG